MIDYIFILFYYYNIPEAHYTISGASLHHYMCIPKNNFYLMNQEISKNSIIEKIAKEKLVETLVNRYNKDRSPYLDDLCQDIYIELLSKPDEKIAGMYERGELEWFIRKIIRNNINSFTSPFYSKYESFRKITNSIDEKKYKF